MRIIIIIFTVNQYLSKLK